MLSRHAETRCQQRGVPLRVLATVLDHADIDQPIGCNCRLLRGEPETGAETQP